MILLQYIRLNILDNLEKCLKGKRKWNNGSILFILSKKNKFVKNQNFRNTLTSVRFIVRIYIVEQIVEQIFHI